jgi:creatinine amidohydrolase
MSWPAVAALDKRTPVVVPTAALEQHGHHLPVFVDSILVGEIVRRSEARLQDRVLVAPVLWLGNSEHHLDFAGTLSAAPRTYLDLINDLVENFLAHGFKRIVIVNGHGGNNVPCQQAIFEIRQRHRERDDLLLLFSAYWALGGDPRPLDGSFVQKSMGHACEWETSMMLALRPELVGDYQHAEPVDPRGAFDPASCAWTTKDRTGAGHIGAPAAASRAKGEALLDGFTDDVVGFLRRVIDWDGRAWS